MYYIGIDLGTSAIKVILCDSCGAVLNTVSCPYDLHINGLCSEQNPSDWWSAVCDAVHRLLKGYDKSQVAAIGSGGQMHGLVMLDKSADIIRPAMLWNDGRAADETEYLNNTIGKELLIEQTGNIAYAGFTAPKLLWVKKHEPKSFERLSMILLPKDYITYKLTGEYATDVSDASGMLFFDCKNRKYSDKMLSICGIDHDMLPTVYESSRIVGTLTANSALQLGLSRSVKVVAGAGDNAAAAIGLGVVKNGDCNISLGTSGTLFIASDNYICDSSGALHSFCHANGKYHLMGCMLSAASCNKWFCDNILQTSDYAALQKGITSSGRNNIYFLPYLMGERCPHNDPDAAGAFVGLKLDTTREDMLLAVLEGVAFGIKDSAELAKNTGVVIKSSQLCGGGAKSSLWQQIIANVMDCEIAVPVFEEGPAFGGVILAMAGDGAISCVDDAKSFVKIKKTIEPLKEVSKRYSEKYEKFRSLYPMLKNFY